MKKKNAAALMAAAMAASLLVGCGGGAASSSAATSTADSTPAESKVESTAESTAADGDETLTVWAWDPQLQHLRPETGGGHLPEGPPQLQAEH